MDDEQQAELDRRHRSLIERDRIIGLEAEAQAARAHAARLREQLDVATERLARKNDKIRQLTARLAEPVAGRPMPALSRSIALLKRLTRR